MKKILFGFCAIAFIATGCSKDTQEQDPLPVEGDGVLEVRLVNPPSRVPTRASSLQLAPDLTLAAELAVKNYTIYVFDADGILEKRVTVESPAENEITRITGITSTSTKTVAVIANNHEDVGVPSFATNHYEEFDTTFLPLTDQPSNALTTQNYGLIMTGKTSNVIVRPREVTSVNVPIERVVAKVVLGKITLDRELDLEQLADFDINGVSMQRVLSEATIGPLDVEIKANNADVVYVGGLVGSTSLSGSGAIGSSGYANLSSMESLLVQVLNGAIETVQSILTAVPGITSNILQLVDEIAGNLLLKGLIDTALLGINSAIDGLVNTLLVGTILEGASDLVSFTLETGLVFQMDEYFYVMPNNPTMFDDPDAFKSTLISLVVTYDGTKYYYPIEINSPDYMDVGSNTVNGKYIERNTIYVVNMNIRSLMGNEDPDQPAKPGLLEVTVTPQNWRGPITQNVNW